MNRFTQILLYGPAALVTAQVPARTAAVPDCPPETTTEVGMGADMQPFEARDGGDDPAASHA